MWEMRNAYSILVGKPEGKRPFEIRRRRWEYNIKKWILGKDGGELWIGIIWLMIRPSGGPL
jgi:hypothetical protein